MTIEAIVTQYSDTQTRIPALELAQSLIGKPLALSTELVSFIIQAVREDEQRRRVYVVAQERKEE